MKVLTHKRGVEARRQSIDSWNVDKKDKQSILEFLDAYERGEVTGRIGTNMQATIERTIEYLKPVFIHINKNKPVSKLKKQDKKIIQDFLSDLLKDKIKSKLNKPYSLKTKKLMLRTFINYLKWKLPEEHLILTRVLGIRIDNKLPEPEFLTESEITKLYKSCSTASQRYLVAVLFASGTRAEEFINIRYADIDLPKNNEVFVKLRVQNPYSKTKGRTINLYWSHTLEAVREYTEERLKEGMQPNDPIFNIKYDTARAWLRSLGKRALNKNVHFHLFRSSCATWMVDKIPNKAEYCYFFGWNFSSPMPDVYIARKGIDMKHVNEKFEKTELEELKSQLMKEENQRKILNEKLLKMEERFLEMFGDGPNERKALEILTQKN